MNTFLTIKNPIVLEKGDFHPGATVNKTIIVPKIKTNGTKVYKRALKAKLFVPTSQVLLIS